MNAWAIKRGGVVERRADRVVKLALSPGESRKTTLVSVPVSRRRVEQRLRDTGCFPPLVDIGGRPLIREQELNTLETVAPALPRGPRFFFERDEEEEEREKESLSP